LSLSVDNLFVFIIIFAHYKVPEKLHHKVLFWGILGALVLRAVFIGLGAAAVERWGWILYFFGAFLVYTGIKLLFHREKKVDPEQSPIVKLAHRFLRVTKTYQADRFFIKRSGLWWVTPLFIIVLIVEATDVIFAVDSIPAVFGISTDPFIVYTSNIFAILGLRAMFFALEGVIHMFRFLKVGLAIILTLIGLKLLLLHWAEEKWGFHAGEYVVLAMIGLVLAGSMGMSVLLPRKKRR
jgi:tellurite resistance protein TerC